MAKKEVDLRPGNLHGFRYYQGKDGGIYVTTPNGRYAVPLTKEQIEGLYLGIFDLEDFDMDAYCAFYYPKDFPKKAG